MSVPSNIKIDAFGADAGLTLPKTIMDVRLLMTRVEQNNPLHSATMEAFRNVFRADVYMEPIEMTPTVEQSGRFQMRVYEQDYRQMTRETWNRARLDRAYEEFKATVLTSWERTAQEDRT